LPRFLPPRFAARWAPHTAILQFLTVCLSASKITSVVCLGSSFTTARKTGCEVFHLESIFAALGRRPMPVISSQSYFCFVFPLFFSSRGGSHSIALRGPENFRLFPLTAPCFLSILAYSDARSIHAIEARFLFSFHLPPLLLQIIRFLRLKPRSGFPLKSLTLCRAPLLMGLREREWPSPLFSPVCFKHQEFC